MGKFLRPLGFLLSIQLKYLLFIQAIPNITPFQVLKEEIPDLVYLYVFLYLLYLLILNKKKTIM